MEGGRHVAQEYALEKLFIQREHLFTQTLIYTQQPVSFIVETEQNKTLQLNFG